MFRTKYSIHIILSGRSKSLSNTTQPPALDLTNDFETIHVRKYMPVAGIVYETLFNHPNLRIAVKHHKST